MATVAPSRVLPYTEEQLAELCRLKHDKLYWMKTCLKLKHQDRGWVPFKAYEWQEIYSRNRKSRRNIVLKSRDIGSSSYHVADRLHDVVFNPPGDILIAADKADNASTLIDIARGYIQNLPDWLSVSLTKDNTMELELGVLGSSVAALTGTPRSGRTKRCRHLICTEMAHWRDDHEYWSAVTGSLSRGGTIDVESTACGEDNLFAEIWKYNESWGFDHWFFGCWESPDHDEPWFEQKCKENTDDDRKQEYPENPDEAFKSVAGSVFGDVMNLAHEDAPEPSEYLPGHSYVIFWDLGKHANRLGRNAAVGVCLDVTTDMHYVANIDCLQNAPYTVVQECIEQQQQRYQAVAYLEVNGPGEPVLDNLNVAASGFFTSSKSKQQMISKTRWAIEKGLLKWAPGPEHSRLDVEMARYKWDDAAIAQDHVIALCGAELCSRSGGVGRVY